MLKPAVNTASLVLGLALQILGQDVPQTYEYALVIDAGSSGSRIHVYRYVWDAQAVHSFPKIELPDKKFKITPGLSSFASNPKVLVAMPSSFRKYKKNPRILRLE